jgi:hypothetical protein
VVELDGINEIGHEDEIQIYVDGIGPYNWTSFTWMDVNEIDDIHGHNFFHEWKKEHQNTLNQPIWMKMKTTMKTMFVGDGNIGVLYIH